MYKELVICIVIIILIFICDLITQSYTKKTVNQVCRRTRKIKTNIRKSE